MLLDPGLLLDNGLLITGDNTPQLVTSGLILNLDAGNNTSYPGSGSTWFDLSPSGYNTTLYNSPTYSTPPGTLTFDGSNEYGQVTDNGFGKFNYQSFTVSTWFKPSTVSGYSPHFSYDYTSHNAPYYAIHLRQDNANVFFGWNDAGSYTSATTLVGGALAINSWYNLTAVFTSGRQELWLNNSIVDSKANAATITFYNQPVRIGLTNWNAYIKGGLATVFFYNRALSSAEIQQNFNALRGRYGV